MAQLIALHKTPPDPEAYDRYYFAHHVPLAKQFPGLQKYEVSRGAIAGADGPSDLHLVAVLHFESLTAAQAALDGPAGQAALADLPNFALPGNVEILLFDNEVL
ncbi:EthD family reductase [Amycolatopsis jejuensis]|uniref:EthD family reductase n=1 Tax=Amycolatopsis jejuensis TaxID=330084 RepID=UPI000526C6B3|nr:EthD family reductase [Amycolatopsis jejuensis]